jgi:quercetin dioxygenase-like cupin family protein
MSGFGALAELPWERVTDKIERRVLAGQQGMIVWWKLKAGAHAAAHRHPHEQIVWMLRANGLPHRERSEINDPGRCCSDTRQY